MIAKQLLFLCVLGLLSSGCALSDNLIRTTLVQPVKFNNYWDEKRQTHHFREWAEWELERARSHARAELDNYECEPFSIDEEHGFKEGFVDLLLYGDTGHPPPLPPRRYWRIKYQNADGYEAIQDWFKGYQHGALVAQATEFRNYVTVPISDALMKETLPYYSGRLSSLIQTEFDDPSLDETDDEFPMDVLAGGPDPAPPAAPSNVTWPPTEKRLPESPETAPESSGAVEPLLVHQAEVTTGIGRSINVDSASPSPIEHSDGDRISGPAKETSTGLEPASFVEPAAPPGTDMQPTSESLKSDLGFDPSGPGTHIATNALAVSSETHASEAPVQAGSPARVQVSTTRRTEETEPLPGINPVSQPELAFVAEPTPKSMANIDPSREIQTAEFEREPSSRNGLLWPVLVSALLIAAVVWIQRCTSVGADVDRRRRPSSKPARSDASSRSRRDSRTSALRSTQTDGQGRGERKPSWTIVAMLGLLVCCLSTGCASLTNPVSNGIPVRRLPPELLAAPRRDNLQTIPLSLLRHPKQDDYILAAGDVMGVFIAGVFPLTLADQALPTPPVRFPSQIDPLGAGLPPSLGYPIGIRNDGTLALPLVEPILLEGLTVEEANERVRKAYVDSGILQPGREAVMITLMQPRQVRILVFRQEIGGFSAGGRGDISSNNVKQGTGHIVDLRAYENDVLTALANTGGLPGLDAYDGIFIFRGGQSNVALTETLKAQSSCEDVSSLAELGVKTDYIPTRWMPGEPLPFEPEDVLLHEGDVVLLEARVKDLFYTGGLLPVGERVLPRDYDLDVVEAVAQVTGTLVNGAFGGNNFTGRLIQQGIGNPNPSALTVIRKTPNGGLIPISVDLNRALRDPRERILVQPDDVLILQESGNEAIARYFNDIFNFNIVVQAIQRGSATGAAGVTQVPVGR